MTHKVYSMPFPAVYGALVAKAERKGKTAAEVHELTAWLTGYDLETLFNYETSSLTYGEFFTQAPQYQPSRVKITGKICGVQIEAIQDPLMQEIRRLDRLVDWLAKGKTVAQIIEKYQ